MKYIYVFEEGGYGVSDHPPTETDLESVADGRLQILYVSTERSLSEIDADGSEMDTNKCSIVRPSDFDDDVPAIGDRPFHSL